MRNHICKIRELTQIANGIFSLTLEAPDISRSAVPGQFVHINCGDALLLRRPISICAAHNGLIRLIFESKGAGTAYLSKYAASDSLDLLGPFGRGFFDDNRLSAKRILLLGGGIGVPPLLFAATRSSAAYLHALLGFANARKAILLDEFSKVCNSTEIATDDGSLGARAFVTELLEKKLKDTDFDLLLACGPRLMLRTVTDIASRYNLPCRISMEQRMACGIGACLVCSCKTNKGYVRVCADGPVFDAEEVCWDET